MELTLIGIFIEGLLSFLSPCVLPILPLYMSYLTGGSKYVHSFGYLSSNRKRTFIGTVFFVLGICLTLTILSVTVNLLSNFLSTYSEIISIIGGTILIVFGLHQIGLINVNILDKEGKPNIDLHLEKMNYFKAFLMGFIFSLGWSPCIGPMLANALLLSATNSLGYLYIVVYGLGLVIPFLVTGLITDKVLDLLARKKDALAWVGKISGVIILIFGVYMIYQGGKSIELIKNMDTVDKSNGSTEDVINTIYDLDFVDQNGNALKLSDYDGKYIVINFSATWCGYCQEELPEYLTFAKENDDCVVVYAMNTSQDGYVETITDYVSEKGIDIPVIIDDGSLNYLCGINSFPSILIFGPDRRCLTGYQGMIEISQMNELLDYAKQIYSE